MDFVGYSNRLCYRRHVIILRIASQWEKVRALFIFFYRFFISLMQTLFLVINENKSFKNTIQIIS